MYLFLFPGPIFQNRMVLIQVLLLALLVWLKNRGSPLKKLTFSQLCSENNITLCIPYLLLCASKFGECVLWQSPEEYCLWESLSELLGKLFVSDCVWRCSVVRFWFCLSQFWAVGTMLGRWWFLLISTTCTSYPEANQGSPHWVTHSCSTGQLSIYHATKYVFGLFP